MGWKEIDDTLANYLEWIADKLLRTKLGMRVNFYGNTILIETVSSYTFNSSDKHHQNNLEP